jgi:protein TonB
MGYQALLFCPDEKTARTVTQVLSELDFTVVPCTEPFAAVKKLMGEHFDAVVVDCDNEQNATLLLKSARNAPNNQSALAVAVVEGQAGVAKAFRIGANLVLTKPINVEQAKGTLRVARGLLRKSESAKPATAAAKPAVVAPGAGPLLVSSTPAAAPPVSAVSPIVSAPIQKPVAQPSFAASASSVRPEGDDSAREVTPPRIVEASAPEAKPEVTFSKQVTSASSSAGLSIVASSGAASSGAASAAAPAREAASGAEQQKSVEVIPEAKAAVEKEAIVEESSEVEASAAPAPSFTFGGAVGSGSKPASGGSKKTLIAVAALVVIAAGGYFAWTQFGPSQGTATVSTPVAARPASTTPVPQAAPSAVAATPDAASSVTHSATVTSTPAGAAQPAKVAKPVPAPTAAGVAQTHASKASPVADSAKTVVADSKAPTTSDEASQPIVVRKSAARTAAGKTLSTSDAPDPIMTGIAAAGDGGTLPNLLTGSSGAPAPVLQTLSISQGVSQGLILKKISPSYPTNALRMRIEGSVELLATISKKGDISAVKILSGDPNLARAAADAVKQWKYKPYLLDGSPVEIQTQVTVNFKLPR